MKEKPILFSTPMVQAILAGRKTQTRRLVRENIHSSCAEICQYSDMDPIWIQRSGYDGSICGTMKAPYNVGDILWVRETLYQNGELGLEYIADKEGIPEEIIPNAYGPYGGSYSHRAIPNIHMPKWAARIFLEIKSLRAEPLHHISEDDAIAEGVKFDEHSGYYFVGDRIMQPFATTAFMHLWSQINGEDSWSANPWVWVIQFEIIERLSDK